MNAHFMKKLEEYLRLESHAWWRVSMEDAGQPVVVTLSKNHLTIVSKYDQPLAHWSLHAIRQVNPGELPATFTPDVHDGGETIEINNAEIVDILCEQLTSDRDEIQNQSSATWSLPVYVLVLLAALTGAIYYFSAPIAASLAGYISASERSLIGERTFVHVHQTVGERCRTMVDDRVLAKLGDKMFGGDAEIRVIHSEHKITAHLPGEILIVSDALLHDHDQFPVIGGYLLEENLRRYQMDSVATLFRTVGLLSTVRFILQGQLNESDLAAFAEMQIFKEKMPVDPDHLVQSFQSIGLPILPYAYARGLTELTTSRHRNNVIAAPLLRDREWLDLQNICLNSLVAR